MYTSLTELIYCTPARPGQHVPVAHTDTSNHDPTPSQTFSESIPDEDILEGAVTDPNVLAEVKLPTKPSTPSQLSRLSYIHSSQIEYRWSVEKAAEKLELPSFQIMIRRFLYDQLYPDSRLPSDQIDTNAYPNLNGGVSIFYSATATFRAPSDISGITGMHREYIRATPSWRLGPARYDCIYVNSADESESMHGLEIARVMAFFSVVHGEEEYQCALIHWFSRPGTGPDENTGLWVVEPDFDDDGNPFLDIVHVDSIYRAAHLLPVYKTTEYTLRTLTMHDTLDTFKRFYVNKFVDYHAFEIAF
jgi:hypothetical protein